MAFNWQTFRTRTLTAAVFVIVMLTGLLWNHWSFLTLFTIIHFGCWWEYLKLSEKIYHTRIDRFIKYFFCFSGFLVFLAVGYSHHSYDFWFTVSGVEFNLKWRTIILILLCLFAFFFQNKKLPDKQKWFLAGGLIYISLSWGLMIDFYRERDLADFYGEGVLNFTLVVVANFFPIVVVASIWINDTMAYLIGSLIGKSPLSSISPKKTWEGTIGGILLSCIVVGFSISYSLEFLHFKPVYHFFTIPGIAAITGTFGDLFESKLKRMAGVKDSAQIMPGHGGFLDRFDSMLFATPFVWLYVYFFL